MILFYYKGKKLKYLHIIPNEKFTTPCIEFINKNFTDEEHLFLVIDGVSTKKIVLKKYQNVRHIVSLYKVQNRYLGWIFSIISLSFLFPILFYYSLKSKKIYFHGLFDKRYILFLYVFTFFLKKSYWLVWGGDLYCYRKRKNRFLNKIYYRMESLVKGNFRGYLTLTKGDYVLAKKWFLAKGESYVTPMYPNSLYKDLKLDNFFSNKDELYIQIGNSGDPENNHYDILKKLSKFKDDRIKIYCILSYGGSEVYKRDLIKYGNEVFKEKFIPILNFMKLDEYMKFISNIDIAIFAHKRQQGVGNISSFLSMEKTVYLREDVTTYEDFVNLGIKIKSFEKINELEKLEIFNKEVLRKNKEIMKKEFSEERLKEQWQETFEAL